MITIDFSISIAIFLTFCLLLVIGQWIVYNKKEGQDIKKTKHLAQCPYCNYLFYDFENKTLKTCPRCKSYIEQNKEEKNENNE